MKQRIPLSQREKHGSAYHLSLLAAVTSFSEYIFLTNWWRPDLFSTGFQKNLFPYDRFVVWGKSNERWQSLLSVPEVLQTIFVGIEAHRLDDGQTILFLQFEKLEEIWETKTRKENKESHIRLHRFLKIVHQLVESEKYLGCLLDTSMVQGRHRLHYKLLRA